MDIWIVIDRYDHSEQILTAHLTKKGALIEAFKTLVESLENICGSDWGVEDEVENEFKEDYPDAYEFKEDYPDAYEFVKQHRSNISEAKTADLHKYIDDLGQWVGEHSDWQIDVSIQTTRMQA